MAEGAYPASWYAATRDAAPDRPQLAGQTEADIAVVGGGFAGLHTARLLAQQGQRVALVERHRIAWGASGRNGGFVGPGYAARSGLLIDKLGLDHSRRLYAQSQVGVEIVRQAIEAFGRPDILIARAAPPSSSGRASSPGARLRLAKSSTRPAPSSRFTIRHRSISIR